MMAVYEYKCKRCEEEFEIQASMGDYEDLFPVCPKCGGQNLVRRWTGISTQIN
jgi:putative FmdB family regulatory protein